MPERLNQTVVNAHDILKQTNCTYISYQIRGFYSRNFKESKGATVELLAKALLKSAHVKNVKIRQIIKVVKIHKIKSRNKAITGLFINFC